MSKYPVKRKPGAPSTIDEHAADVVRSTEAGETGFSFRYSYTEVSAAGSTARFKSKRVGYEDGKLCAESFEGHVGRGLYDRMMNETQRLFLDQTARFLDAFGGFRSATDKRRGRG